MEEVWNPSAMTRLRDTLTKLRNKKDSAWTFDEFELFLRRYERLGASTIRKRLAHLRFMADRERHVLPVVLDGSREDLVNSFCAYVTAREEIEECDWGALSNDHKAIRNLGRFPGIPSDVWPTAPTRTSHEDLWLPSPEQVYDLLHANYGAKNSFQNAHIRYLLAANFGYGLRAPSELHSLRVQDLDADHHILVVTEPKKSGRRRRLVVEPSWLCCGSKRLGLADNLKWRARTKSQTDAFFARKDGSPYPSKEMLAKDLNAAVKPLFPWYHPYLGRHWSVNAQLVETGGDWNKVARWHGHENVKQTMSAYAPSFEVYARLYGKNWLARAFEKNARK